ncbi:MAG: hypothetical protein MJZ81_09580 [Bacteroidales bacterium]|nr:hypothetical protein [Bacteroidales bacterium]
MSAFCAVGVDASRITDCYDFKMSVKVPRVYDNMSSTGYRKYQTQKIVGEMLVTYDTVDPFGTTISFRNVVNRTHKIGGENVVYIAEPATAVRWNYIGSNRSGLFKTPSVSFDAELWPTYNVVQKVEEDNSLILSFAGRGSSSSSSKWRGRSGSRTVTMVNGSVVGTLGSGCYDYGHLSPTRIIGPFSPWFDVLSDVASVDGTWKAKFNRKKSGIVED